MLFRALVEKSPAIETERNIHAPAHLPVAARHREIPRSRNENKRIRIPQILARTVTVPCQWRLATEKSPAIETKTIAPENHKDSPAAALR